MKRLVLVGFAVVLCAIAFGTISAQADSSFAETPVTESPVPDMTNEYSHALTVRVKSPGGSDGSPSGFSPDICFVNDMGEIECLFTLRRDAPPEGYLLYLYDRYFQYVEGDEWCNLQIKHGGRNAVTPGCVWGTGHVYTLSVKISMGGTVDADYTHERQEWYLGDGEFGPTEGDQGILGLNKECLRKMREMARTGDYGPVPECAGQTYYAD